MNLEELEKCELPVKLECCDGEYINYFKMITVTSFNTFGLLITDNDGVDRYLSRERLRHYKIKKKVKEITLYRYTHDHGDHCSQSCWVSRERASKNIIKTETKVVEVEV